MTSDSAQYWCLSACDSIAQLANSCGSPHHVQTPFEVLVGIQDLRKRALRSLRLKALLQPYFS
jgi:hypothetical protein